eukprot:3723553-Lingulodinium_polyedra.AAC.1
MFYMQSFRQRNSETVKDYIDREELVWNSLCDAIRILSGSGPEIDVEPFHAQLRSILFFQRSQISTRDYPLVMAECSFSIDYSQIVEAMKTSYT